MTDAPKLINDMVGAGFKVNALARRFGVATQTLSDIRGGRIREPSCYGEIKRFHVELESIGLVKKHVDLSGARAF